MKVTVKYFALLRETVGNASEEFSLGDQATLLNLLSLIVQRHPPLRGLIFESDGKSLSKSYQVLVSGEYTRDLARTLREGDVVAILPPVAGG